MKGRILAVDDEPAILEIVKLDLEAEGYEVVTAADGASALAALASDGCVLAVLDVMLPDIDGFDLARRIRQDSDIPIVMLSARDSDVDKALGLGIGADDYVTKPFSPVELVARVKAHLRRYAGTTARAGADALVLSAGPLRLDVGRHLVSVHGAAIDLTPHEFEILRMLAEHPGRVYTKAQIYETVWREEPFGDLSTVQVHVHRLRAKLEEAGADPRLVTTVWGIGYRLEETAAP